MNLSRRFIIHWNPVCRSKLRGIRPIFQYEGNAMAKDASEHVKRAETLLAQRELAQALSEADAAIAADDNNPKAWLAKGKILKGQNNFEEAQRCFDRGLAYDLNSEIMWLEKADVLISLNRLDEAKRSLARALKIKPDFVEANITKGKLHIRTREYLQALEAFDAILKVQPRNAEAWIGKGNTVFMGFNDPKGGLEALRKAIEIDRRSTEAWMNLGVIHRSLQEHKLAIKAFNEVLKINPDNKEAERYRDFCIRKLPQEDTDTLKGLTYISNWDDAQQLAGDKIGNWDAAEEVHAEEPPTANLDNSETYPQPPRQEPETRAANWDGAETVEGPKAEPMVKDPTWNNAQRVDASTPRDPKAANWNSAETLEAPEARAVNWDHAEEVDGGPEEGSNATGDEGMNPEEEDIEDWSAPKKVITITCPKCKGPITAEKGDEPVLVHCSRCGAKGMIK